MTVRWRRPGAGERDARPTDDLGPRREREPIEEQRAQLLRTLNKTAVATTVIGVIFALTSDHELHQMAPFLFAWSVGWSLASASLRAQRRVKNGRRSDER